MRILQPNVYSSIGLGLDSSAQAVHLFGYDASPSTALETIWTEGGTYLPIGTAATMTISSSSTSDTSAGTGARTCRVTGILSTGASTTETATMNGQSGVTLANQYKAINNIEVLTTGSGLTNAGNIFVGTGTITAGKPLTPHYALPVSLGKRGSAFYTVPTGKVLLVNQLHFNSMDSGAVCGIQIIVYEATAAHYTTMATFAHISSGGGFVYEFKMPLKIVAGDNVAVYSSHATGTTGKYCFVECTELDLATQTAF